MTPPRRGPGPVLEDRLRARFAAAQGREGRGPCLSWRTGPAAAGHGGIMTVMVEWFSDDGELASEVIELLAGL